MQSSLNCREQKTLCILGLIIVMVVDLTLVIKGVCYNYV